MFIIRVIIHNNSSSVKKCSGLNQERNLHRSKLIRGWILTWETTEDALFLWGRVIMDYDSYYKVLMLDLFLLQMITDGLECCDVFILTAPIHCRASITETHSSKPDEETLILISSTFSFGLNCSFKVSG